MSGEFYKYYRSGQDALNSQAKGWRQANGADWDDDSNSGEMLSGIFQSGFSGNPCADMYRAWVYPDMYPKERQPVLSNWTDDDLEIYCGIVDK